MIAHWFPFNYFVYSHCENTDKKQLFKIWFDQRASQNPMQEDWTAFSGLIKSRNRITPLSNQRLLLQPTNHLERCTFRCSHVHSGKGIKDRLSVQRVTCWGNSCFLRPYLQPQTWNAWNMGWVWALWSCKPSLVMGHLHVALLLSKCISFSDLPEDTSQSLPTSVFNSALWAVSVGFEFWSLESSRRALPLKTSRPPGPRLRSHDLTILP